MPRTKPKNYLINPSPEQIREIQQRNRPLVMILQFRKRNRPTVIIDLCEGFLGFNRYIFTATGRLEVHRIMTSRPYKSNTVWSGMCRLADASYAKLEDAIAVAEALAELPEKHLKTPMWEWVD